MRPLYFLLAALALQAQSIDAGSPTDAGFQGGLVWNASSAGYADLGAAPWTDLRYSNGTIPFSYSIAAPNGFYRVRFSLMEPNKAAAGQRSFTITANGQSSAALDLFKLAGLRTQYTLDMFVPVNNGVLSIVFRSTLGNAVVSAIEVSPYVDKLTTVCDASADGVLRLVNMKFGLCWKVAGVYQWTNELPVGGMTLANLIKAGAAVEWEDTASQPCVTVYFGYGQLLADELRNRGYHQGYSTLSGWVPETNPLDFCKFPLA